MYFEVMEEYEEDAPMPDESGKLDVSSRAWASIDDRIWTWAGNIVELDLSFNNLASIPREIGELKVLRRLDASRNRIEFLPMELGRCARLRELRLNHNRIRTLPPTLGDCELLEVLEARSNRIEAVPAELSTLIHLRTLHLSENKIAGLPLELADCAALEEFDLTANDPALDIVPPHKLGDAAMIRFALARERERRGEEARLRAANEELEALVRSYDLEKIALREEIARIRKQNEILIDEMPHNYMACKRSISSACIIS